MDAILAGNVDSIFDNPLGWVNLLFQKVENHRALIHRPRRRKVIQFQSRDKPLRRDLQKFGGFLVRIYFICRTISYLSPPAHDGIASMYGVQLMGTHNTITEETG